MIYKTITAALFVLMLFTLSPFTFGKDLHQKSSNPSYKGGQSKHYGSSKGHISSGYGSSHNTNLFDKHKTFHNKYYKNHPGTQNFKYYNYGSYGYGNSRYRNKHKNYNKHYYYNSYYGDYPYYRPGGYVSYGYDNYYTEPEYYGYEEEIPYGYGSTLGTVPERRSNLDVNNYVYGPEYRDNNAEYYPEEGYGNSDDYQEAPGGYSYAPDPGGRTIYVWTDGSGVEHFVNDFGLVPDKFRDEVRLVV